jgi:hypothetical protein
VVRRTPQVAAFLSQVHERLLAKAAGDTFMISVGDAMEVLRALLPWGVDAPMLAEYATLRERLREVSRERGMLPWVEIDQAADMVEELAQATPQRVADWFQRMDDGEKIRLSLRNGEDNSGVVTVGTLVGYRGEPTVLVKLAPHTTTSWPLAHVVEEKELQ